MSRSNGMIDKIDDLMIGKSKRSRKHDAQIVADARLGQRNSVAIGDLSSWRRDSQRISRRLPLGFPARHQIRWVGRQGRFVRSRVRDDTKSDRAHPDHQPLIHQVAKTASPGASRKEFLGYWSVS